jgi:hypothetical protein
VHLTAESFSDRPATREPLVDEILRHGVPLIGSMPGRRGAGVMDNQQRNHSKIFLKKAEDYLASAEDNLAMERPTPGAGDAIHAGISAKDAIVAALTGSTRKGRDHATAAKELEQSLGQRPEAPKAERALRELLAAKAMSSTAPR